MTVEDPVQPMMEWLLPGEEQLGALLMGGGILAVVALAFLFLSYLLTAAQVGPGVAFNHLGRSLRVVATELGHFSIRRLWAMTWLAFQEAIRRRVLVAFGIFLLVMLMAGWYLDVDTDNPAQLYMGFVLWLTNLLVLILALVLSTFSLPNDIRNRTIYTVVTKPVRLGELVLGRMLGFTLIGTLILAVMCAVSYVFVWRGLSHTHEVEMSSLADDPTNFDENDTSRIGKTGQTTRDDHHRHAVFLNPDGNGYTDIKKGHRHRVTKVDENEYVLGPPVGHMEAKMPQYGTLTFTDRNGAPAEKGVNVGNEWTYRSYIQGESYASAIWTFDGVTRHRFSQSEFPDGVPLEMTLRVFRTHKGNIEEGVHGNLEVIEYVPAGENRPPLEVLVASFQAVEHATDHINIPRKIKKAFPDGTSRTVDLFEDLAHDGKLIVRVKCVEGGQYFGAAKPDMYLLTGNNWFMLNFAKSYVSIWFQMVLIIAFGVMFSTFLSGPVALLATVMSYITGYFTQFIGDLLSGKAEGGGPIESMIRIIEQSNLVTPLEPGLGTTVVQSLDTFFMSIMWAFSQVLPDYSKFHTASYVAHGYNIPPELMLQHFLTTLVYFLALAALGYFIFKSREVAA